MNSNPSDPVSSDVTEIPTNPGNGDVAVIQGIAQRFHEGWHPLSAEEIALIATEQFNNVSSLTTFQHIVELKEDVQVLREVIKQLQASRMKADDSLVSLAAKLDDDAGVTDTDYESTVLSGLN